jgi:hypothetical protein
MPLTEEIYGIIMNLIELIKDDKIGAENPSL